MDNIVNIRDLKSPDGVVYVHGNPIQAIQLSYMGGILDGEGTIRIDKMKSKASLRSNKRINPCYSVHMSLGMTDPRIPYMFYSVFGGSKRVECVPTRHPVYRWHLRGNKSAYPVLKALLPYLIVKRNNALLAIEFIQNWKTPVNRQQGLSGSELSRREESYLKMRKFNAVGEAGATTKQENIREDEAIVWTMPKGIEEEPKSTSRQLCFDWSVG
jgi:hypothetical protein